MRIRKHLRLTTQLSAAAGGCGGGGGEHSPLQSPVCLLSHLPSVVFDPPSSLPKVTKVEDFDAIGGSFENSSIGADDSASTLKIAGDGEVKSINFEEEEEEEEERVVLCGMKNATTGWKCKKQAARGKVHCEHHFQQLRNYNITRNKRNQMKKKMKTEEDQAMSGSRRKRKAALDSNYPYDYYYYSGFGPSWGKKRGNTNTNTNANNIKKYESVAQQEDEGFVFSSSSSSEKCEIDEIDYFKDSDNEEEEECGEIGKKVVCKRMSGSGWKCQAVAARGKLLCKHHLEQQRKYVIKQKRNHRSKRKKMKKDMADPAAIVAKTTFSSNQQDCSGYGTSDWGKNRGVDTKSDDVFADYQALRVSPLPSEVSGIDRIRIDYAEDDDSDDNVIR